MESKIWLIVVDKFLSVWHEFLFFRTLSCQPKTFVCVLWKCFRELCYCSEEQKKATRSFAIDSFIFHVHLQRKMHGFRTRVKVCILLNSKQPLYTGNDNQRSEDRFTLRYFVIVKYNVDDSRGIQLASPAEIPNSLTFFQSIRYLPFSSITKHTKSTECLRELISKKCRRLKIGNSLLPPAIY